MSCNCGQNWAATIKTSCNDPASRESVVAALEVLSQNCCVGELIVSGQSPIEDATTAFAAGFPDGVASCTCDCVWLYNSVDNILFVNCTDQYTTEGNWFIVGQENCFGTLTTVGLSPDGTEQNRLDSIAEAFPNGIVAGCNIYFISRQDGTACYSTDDGTTWICLEPVVVDQTDWFPISNLITISSPVSSITINNIPADYRHLVLVCHLRATGAGTVYAIYYNLNGDSGAGQYIYQTSEGGAAYTGTQASNTVFVVSRGAAGAGADSAYNYSSHTMWFHNYTQSTLYKNMIYNGHSGTTISASNLTTWGGGYWKNSADQITSIAITLASGGTNFAAGSTYMLYGVGKL